jgi:hypothetical protein
MDLGAPRQRPCSISLLKYNLPTVTTQSQALEPIAQDGTSMLLVERYFREDQKSSGDSFLHCFID